MLRSFFVATLAYVFLYSTAVSAQTTFREDFQLESCPVSPVPFLLDADVSHISSLSLFGQTPLAWTSYGTSCQTEGYLTFAATNESAIVYDIGKAVTTKPGYLMAIEVRTHSTSEVVLYGVEVGANLNGFNTVNALLATDLVREVAVFPTNANVSFQSWLLRSPFEGSSYLSVPMTQHDGFSFDRVLITANPTPGDPKAHVKMSYLSMSKSCNAAIHDSGTSPLASLALGLLGLALVRRRRASSR